MTQQDYEKLRQVIIAANPEISADWSGCGICNTMCSVCDDRPTDKSRPIRLADVLLAIRENIDENGEQQDRLVYSSWNLRNDSLDWHYHNQPETVQFLFNLLVK